MKRISFAMMSTLTVLVLLFGYRTSTTSRATGAGTVAVGSAQTPVTAATTPSSTAVAAGGAASSSGGTTSPTPAASATPSATSTFLGAAADTRYGPVQVQLTVTSGKVTSVSVVEYPTGNGRDQEINAQALPILVNETIEAQSASIDMVTGATYTSNGYLTSLQSALDKAGR